MRFSRRVGGQLFLYDWPDNVRELKKVLHAAVLLAKEDMIRLEHLPEAVASATRAQRTRPASNTPSPPEGVVRIHPTDPDAAEKLHALAVRCKGNVSAMARALQTSRVQVRRLMIRYGVDSDVG